MKEILTAVRLLLIMTVALGLVYPVAMTGFAQVVFSAKANGSLLYQNEKLLGSAVIGQNFSQDRYFQSRPSNAGADGYDAAASGGSNLGPTSKRLLTVLEERAVAVREKNMLSATAKVPGDLVTASGSGLDPHISPAAAAVQLARVAKIRGVSEAAVESLVAKYTESPQFAFLGDARVNVLMLNLALDREL